MSSKKTTRLEKLLAGLNKHGYETVGCTNLGDGAYEGVIRSIEYDHTYVLTAADGWVQAMQMLFEASQLEASKHRLAVLNLAMRLHGRFLGCRFGYDEDADLVVQYDIYPDASITHVALALGQLYYVASTAFPLFADALKGDLIDEARIDAAFLAAPQSN